MNTIFIENVNEKEKKAWTPFKGVKSGWFICLNPDPEWEKSYWTRLVLGSESAFRAPTLSIQRKRAIML
jgi:hypothetical protein